MQRQSQSKTGSKRGFGAMSASQRRRISSMGGKASHGGGRSRSSQESRFEDNDDDQQYQTRGQWSSGRGGYDDENDFNEDDDRSRRGYRASDVDEDEDYDSSQRGRYSRGLSDNYNEDEDQERNDYGRYQFESRDMGQRGYQSDYEDSRYGTPSRRRDEDYDNGRWEPNQSSSRSESGQGRGFAGMDRSEQRRIASMGGRASHSGQGRRSSQSSSQGRRSR
jgi:hypothetical protein